MSMPFVSAVQVHKQINNLLQTCPFHIIFVDTDFRIVKAVLQEHGHWALAAGGWCH